SSIDALIEIDAPLDGRALMGATYFCTGREPEIANFSDRLLEASRCDHVVVHEKKILLWTVKVVDRSHECRERLGVSLGAFELGYTAEAAFPDAAPRCVCEVRITDRINVIDLVEDAVIRNEIFDGRPQSIV